MSTRCYALALMLLITGALAACGAEEAPSKAAPEKPAAAKAPAAPAATKPATPDSLPNGIVLALAQFVTEKGDDGKDKFVPGPARLEFLYREGGKWKTSEFEDPDSNVFHKAMVYDAGDGPRLLTLGGTRALLKTWELTDSGLSATVLWEKDFGGKFSRMRDAEIGDFKGDGTASLAVATHDKGVVALVHPTGDGFEVEQLDEKENTFVHEIEVGDLNGDGVFEVYATPSEPNRLDGTPQKGEVVRYVPGAGGERTVVADLGERHAKEILIADVDGDGSEELYVSVEGEIEGEGGAKRIKSPV
ncbi:MAG: FG-GAP repeat domain-containing protein, partial [Myxococcota bacterium]